MLESEDTTSTTPETTAAPVEAPATEDTASAAPAKKAARKAPAKKATTRKTAAKKTAAAEDTAPVSTEASPTESAATESGEAAAEAPKKPAKKKAAAKPKKKAEPAAETETQSEPQPESQPESQSGAPEVLFQVPEKPAKKAPARKRTTKKAESAETPAGESDDAATEATADAPKKQAKKKPAKKAAAKADNDESSKQDDATTKKSDEADKSDSGDAEDSSESGGEGDGESGEGTARRRPRRRGGRRRRGRGNSDSGDAGESGDESGDSNSDAEGADSGDDNDEDASGEGTSRRRRQRQRKPRNPEDEIASVSGSTRLEAKKQRRREGREAGRRRAPIVSEAEFLARRESVERVMVIRQREDYTQIGVLEDKVLVEHYVARKSQTSLIGNVYLGRVQNVLPSMEAAFIDIGKGRNAVIYAGEVNWSALGHKDGQPRKIESVLSPGQTILVQVTKDPVGHKGARLSGQVSLPGRFLVYVPDGNTSGISRKLPDTERNRLKTLLKQIVPDSAGVIVRTAAEGASEEELTRDVERLTARWNDIEEKIKAGKGPELLYGEPDLTLKVVRDLFTEDFSKLVVEGDDAWDLVQGYVSHVAPDLEDRLERFEAGDNGKDIFATYRVDEQISKGLDRKVWLPSGGSLIIDRTEAMTVVDVNTGKFTGSGGNLEETVTKNNLEAAEEMVRQLRLRDIGGIIVIDFIDMVLESNRDLVLRRLVECLGRDRTRHQVAEVTSLGLVQMTRKRIGTGLVEAFSEDCTHCKGRGVVIHDHPMETDSGVAEDEPRGRRGRGGRGGRGNNNSSGNSNNGGNNNGGTSKATQAAKPPSPADLAGSRPKPADDEAADAPDAAELTEAPEAADETKAQPKVDPKADATQDTKAKAKPDATAEDQAAGKAEPEPEEPKAPAGPTVVSTTRRRRTATRPAGPPSSTAAPTEPQEQAVPEQASDKAPEQAQDQPADPESADQPEPAAEDEHAVLHVPVKRKGTRKR